MHAYGLYWEQLVELLRQMSVVVGEGAPYSWAISADETQLLMYLTDSPTATDITYKYVDLAPVIPADPLPPPPAPTVTDCDPTTAAMGSEDFMLLVHGTGLQPTAIIVIDGVERPTTWVAFNELTTIMHPSLVLEPGVVPVQVRQAGTLLPPDPSPVTLTWTAPAIVATGATAGIPGSFTPAGAVPPANLAALTGIVASPATAWTPGQYVVLGDASEAHWTGSAWTVGRVPTPATGATAGIPGSFTPAGAVPPANLAALTGIVASPATAWTTGQYVVLGDASHASWAGAAWAQGDAP